MLSLDAGACQASSLQIATASAWGLLRNAFQEFAGPSFVGCEIDTVAPSHRQELASPPGTDSFGSANYSDIWWLPRVVPTDSKPSLAEKFSFGGAHIGLTGKSRSSHFVDHRNLLERKAAERKAVKKCDNGSRI